MRLAPNQPTSRRWRLQTPIQTPTNKALQRTSLSWRWWWYASAPILNNSPLSIFHPRTIINSNRPRRFVFCFQIARIDHSSVRMWRTWTCARWCGTSSSAVNPVVECEFPRACGNGIPFISNILWYKDEASRRCIPRLIRLKISSGVTEQTPQLFFFKSFEVFVEALRVVK